MKLSTFAEREAARYEAGHLTDTERALCDVLAARRAWAANKADEAWLAEHPVTAEDMCDQWGREL